MTTRAERLPVREVRGLEMLRDGKRVLEVSEHEFIVGSQTGKSLYRVRTGQTKGLTETCTCQDFNDRLAACKHIYVVRHWLAAVNDSSPNPPPSFPAPPAKRTSINWSAYNEYQAEEYRLFSALLRELSIGFPEPTKDPHLAGRKPIPLREQVFCAVQKIYLGFSCRRSHGFRDQAAKNSLITKTPFWAVPSRFLCRTDVTDSLHDLLARSAIPLMGIEDRCAIDSTGLRTTRFNYYRKEKYEPTRENDWRKLHALVGVKTHVIPVLEVTDGSASDSPQFPGLLRRAVENGFRFKEVYADKGYLSRENFNAAATLDILPFIPFKTNNTGIAKGSPMYHKMFLFFQYHREAFDQQYGQRAQVESAFGAFKQKFGETLASRKFDSQVNEILCMAISFNITMVIRQMFEVGIFPEFLQPPAGHTAPPAPTTESPARTSLSLNPAFAVTPVTESRLPE